jgi:hypothetical protein
MTGASERRRRPNRLLMALVGLSVIVHLCVFLHISGLYRSRTLTYIDFA